MNEKPQKVPEKSGKAEHPGLKLEQVDLPGLAETFADSINQVFFDGQTLRINFDVTRVDSPPQTQTARRYPACRLVLTPTAAVDLMNQIQRLTTGMVQAGVIKTTPAESAPDRKAN
jgi:hypothetical protein